MEGDLSLAGSLGGLRIANPDHDADADADASPSPPSSSLSARADDLQSQQGPHDPSPGQLASTDSSSSIQTIRPDPLLVPDHRRQDPSPTRQQFPPATAQYAQPPYIPDEYDSLRRGSDPTRRAPSATLYNHPNTSSTSTASNREAARFMSDHVTQQLSDISRSGSRSAAHAADRSIATRPRAERDRDRFRQSAHHAATFIAPQDSSVPSRRLSRHLAPPTSHPPGVQQGSPYTAEGGPLPSSEEWKDRGAATSTRQETDADGNPVSRVVKKGVKDFSFGRTLGEGSYSTVLAATDRHTGREYAIKVLDKRHIIKEKKVKYVNIERDTLNRLTEHPGVVRLYYTFQDERSLYFVLDLASGGELLGVLKKVGSFDLDCTRFYSAQMLDSISYMHSRGIIHRDLKPENVLLDSNMHTKITDFGTAKILDVVGAKGEDGSANPSGGEGAPRAVSFVGTAEYVSPELLTDKNACKASDLWAFGCIVFQLLAGRPPFKAANEYLTFQKIVALEYTFPEGFPPLAKDLIENLLVLDPAQRLTVDQIKAHPFFEGVQWGRGLWRVKAPKPKPHVPSASEPIRLNGGSSAPIALKPSMATSPGLSAPVQLRPQLRSVTDLPPPSQLDIDWSPVLTRRNERILKMGNLNVSSMPLPPSPPQGNGAPDASKKFSRFFGGGANKKKQRLVMVTSTARLVVVPVGGDDKKAKMDLPLMGPGVLVKTYQDAKGLTAFCIEVRDKQYTFEDPRGSTSDPAGTRYSTAEWMEKIEWAKELAVSHSVANSFSADTLYSDVGSSMPSPNSVLSAPADADGGAVAGGAAEGPAVAVVGARNTLRKDADADSLKKRHRFSRRHSKNGLAAVF